jgi:hypothetical protein
MTKRIKWKAKPYWATTSHVFGTLENDDGSPGENKNVDLFEQFDWRCNNWRDAGMYPCDSGQLKEWQWRWEFFRRQQEYRILWFISKKIDSSDTKNRIDEIKEHGLKSLVDPRINNLSETPFEPVGMLWSNPSLVTQTPALATRESLKNLGSDLIDLADEEELPYVAFVKFDLNRPLSQQMSKVTADLEELDLHLIKRKRALRLGGKDQENRSLYLRLIDAEDQGAKPMEIFRQFEFDGVKQIRNARNESSRITGMTEAARKLQRKISVSL